MKYLLDTDMCIYIIEKKPPDIFNRFKTFTVGDIGISSITLAELQFGMFNSQKVEQNLRALDKFVSSLELMPFETNAAVEYGKVRHALQISGSLIGPMDLLISAHALALNVTLVTNNPKHFGRVHGLKLENWTQ